MSQQSRLEAALLDGADETMFVWLFLRGTYTEFDFWWGFYVRLSAAPGEGG